MIVICNLLIQADICIIGVTKQSIEASSVLQAIASAKMSMYACPRCTIELVVQEHPEEVSKPKVE